MCISSPCVTYMLAPVAVGKSAFGMYAMYRAIKQGRTVIYSSRKGGRNVFKHGKAYGLTCGVIDDLRDLRDTTALYISDSMPPAAYKGAFTLLISSPNKDIWSQTCASPGVLRLVLPIFTREEIMELHAIAFQNNPGYTTERVEALYDKWGGMPRNVLTNATNEQWQADLDAMSNAPNLNLLQQSLGRLTALRSIGTAAESHGLIDLAPRGMVEGSSLTPAQYEYYFFDHAQLCSPFVECMYRYSKYPVR
jgi:hypothetical protein